MFLQLNAFAKKLMQIDEYLSKLLEEGTLMKQPLPSLSQQIFLKPPRGFSSDSTI